MTILGWLIPPVHLLLPSAWALMKMSTAVMVLCSALSLASSQPKTSRWVLLASRLLAAFVSLLAVCVLSEYIFHISIGIDTVLAADPASLRPGMASPQTAIAFLVLSVVMFFIRVLKRLAAYPVDLLVFGFCLLVLGMASGYIFGAMRLFGLSSEIRTSPQTLVSLMLLAFVAFSRRAENGVFSVLLRSGIGSTMARIACPLALLFPFLFEAAKATMIRRGQMSAEYTTAIATAISSMLSFALVLLVGWKIDQLEDAIQQLALRDELTNVYNRRGFFMLAEKALQIAYRSGVPFSVLFIDLDGLKLINDTHGHEAGSAILREVGILLRECFRQTDVIGRIGGDEFAVAGQATQTEIRLAAQRLEQTVVQRNLQPRQRYPLSFSSGYATSGAARQETLDDLVGSADSAMYLVKQRKRTSSAGHQSALATHKESPADSAM
jgi:diguanylate cyclase (GGDEF)-like protein